MAPRPEHSGRRSVERIGLSERSAAANRKEREKGLKTNQCCFISPEELWTKEASQLVQQSLMSNDNFLSRTGETI